MKVISNGLSNRTWVSDLQQYEVSEAHLEGVVESSSTVFIQTAIIGSMLAYETTKILNLSKINCESQCLNVYNNVADSSLCDILAKCTSTCWHELSR